MKQNDKNNETISETPSRDGTKRGKNPNSKKNLKPIKQGEVRNPKGRPQGIMDFRKRVELSIKFLSEEYVRKHNEKKENKDNQIDITDVDIMGDIFAQYMNQARNGNLRAADSLLDRLYGKAKQTIEVGGIDGDPIKIQEVKEQAKTKARNILDRWTNKERKDAHLPPLEEVQNEETK